jgi:formate dehydrogenase subunit gamma
MTATHPDSGKAAIHPGDPVQVDRYTTGARINHWITAITLILLAISGLSLFHPSLYWLSALFGGGELVRIIHPWLGVVLIVSFAGLFIRFFRYNLWERTDNVWLARLRDVLAARDENLPEVGKYNAGQKLVFWLMSVLILVLFGSGLVIWYEYFAPYFTIDQQRAAVLVHALAAIVIICVWIVHVYAAIWVRGTISGMVRGRVTGGWAWRHHRRWLRDLAAGKTRAK